MEKTELGNVRGSDKLSLKLSPAAADLLTIKNRFGSAVQTRDLSRARLVKGMAGYVAFVILTGIDLGLIGIGFDFNSVTRLVSRCINNRKGGNFWFTVDDYVEKFTRWAMINRVGRHGGFMIESGPDVIVSTGVAPLGSRNRLDITNGLSLLVFERGL